MSKTMHDLTERVEDDIKDQFEAMIEDPHYSDTLHEICDGAIPIYNSELAACLADDPGLAEVDDPGLLPTNPSVWQIIQTAIYEQLSQHAHQFFEEKKEEYETLKSDMEAEGYSVSRVRGTKTSTYTIFHNEGEEDEKVIHEGLDSEYEAWHWLEQNPEDL